MARIDQGYWYARSAELMQKPIIHLLVWMRVPGDIIFSVGALSLAWFVLRLWVAPRREKGDIPHFPVTIDRVAAPSLSPTIVTRK